MPTPNAHHRGAKSAAIEWTPEKLAAAAVYVALQKGRRTGRPCLGPDDQPAHDYFSTNGRRICPECTALLKERLRGMSSRMYTTSCSPEE